MSIIYCERHSIKWDSDRKDECPACENEPTQIYDANMTPRQELATMRRVVRESLDLIDALKAQRDAWRDMAEYQYGQLRVAKYGDSESDYPVLGALDALAAERYPILKPSTK